MRFGIAGKQNTTFLMNVYIKRWESVCNSIQLPRFYPNSWFISFPKKYIIFEFENKFLESFNWNTDRRRWSWLNNLLSISFGDRSNTSRRNRGVNSFDATAEGENEKKVEKSKVVRSIKAWPWTGCEEKKKNTFFLSLFFEWFKMELKVFLRLTTNKFYFLELFSTTY